MASLVSGYEYDVFISYRQKDNKYDGWVTEFVSNLKKELDATFKEEISIYFDENPHDGLLETHVVDKSLEGKLRSLIFIPIISRTYCDPKSFAWQNEFCAFNNLAIKDHIGREIRLSNGNVSSRILPVKIHDLNEEDMTLLETELGRILRPIEFIFKSPGVNRPLNQSDNPDKNQNQTLYRDQINKVANSVQDIISSIKKIEIKTPFEITAESAIYQDKIYPSRKELVTRKVFRASLIYYVLIFLVVATIAALFILFPGASSKGSSAPDEKSIAVLPFVDLSPAHDKEYFSDGMMEEILNNLYKIGDLKVSSRTSSMQYKGETNKSVKEIATELGVANILEGSVRLYKNKVRITVQLIRAITDEHLWSEDYDRDFSDIFSIQSEVAEEVARALKARISPETHRIIDAKLTSSTEAYDLYLKANNLYIYIEKENEEAIALYKKAIEIDPNFSLAYSQLGFRMISGATFISTSKGMDPLKCWQTAKPYLEKALELNPDNPKAHTNMAWGLLWYEWKFSEAKIEYEKVKRIYPNYSWTDYEVATGQFEQAYKGAVLGTETDSKNANVWQGIIISAYFAGHNPDSVVRKSLTTPVMKDNIWVRSESARVYMYLNEYEKAISIVKKIEKDFREVDSPRNSAIEAISCFKTNQVDETNRILEKLKQKSDITSSGSPAFYTAMIYSVMGNRDLSFTWLEKAYQNHEVEMYWLKVEPPFEPLRSDPRYQAMLDKVGFPK